MIKSSIKRKFLHAAVAAGVAAASIFATSTVPAADHGDGPYASVKRSADLNDLYLFLDPNDNTRVVTILTFAGFTVPGEGVNFSVFDDELVYELQYETSGDADPDRIYRVAFTRKRSSGATPQNARITLPGGRTLVVPTTVSNLTATATEPTVTEDRRSGIRVFAGSADDPFFFDIPGFNRFVAGVLAGNGSAATELQRGRDTFSGYNTLAIALSIPVQRFGRLSGNKLGAAARVYNKTVLDTPNARRAQIDRIGIPGVNVALVPFPKKDLYNRGNTNDDAAGKFGSDIVGTLNALGTNQDNINVLAGLAVTNGDFVRLNTTTANSGPGGGNNEGAGFPGNGRRLQDDVIDTILTVVTNGAVTTGDNVNGNDVTRRNEFPFLGATHQPRANGVVDDQTRN